MSHTSDAQDRADVRPVPPPMAELAPGDRITWHHRQLADMGYTVLPRVLPAALLEELRSAFDDAMARHGRDLSHRRLHRQTGQPDPAAVDEVSREVVSLFELDPVFSELMDFGQPFELAHAALDGDITLCQAGHAHRLPPRTPAHCGWHRDGPSPYVRCTWLLDDVGVDSGPFTLIPGSHRWSDGPPPWFDEPGPRPRAVPGMQHITGPAGSCLVNHTRIWHTNTPNRSERQRRVIFVLYKTAAEPHWNGDGEATYVPCKALFETQTDPRRRALCAGPWLRGDYLPR